MRFAFTRECQCRRLTWQGRLAVAVVLLALLAGFFFSLYGFLAPDDGPKRGLLVVEGWIHDFALDEAVLMYRSGDYSGIVCTGTRIETGSYIQNYKSYPEMTAARLKALGVPPEQIIVCIADDARRDRTYAAAVALREAFMAYGVETTDLHLVTAGPHGRRSRMLFQKALGKEYHIGVTCIDKYDYDAGNWFTCSEGVRDVLGEWIAYLYARLFFYP